MVKLFHIFLILVAYIGCAYGAEELDPNISLEFGVDVLHVNYDEALTNVFYVKDSGTLYGVHGAWKYVSGSDFRIWIDGRYAMGDIDHDNFSGGPDDDSTADLIETRMVLGQDVRVKSTSFTPFIGIGFHYFQDDTAGKFISGTTSGFQQTTKFYYTPIGLMTTVYDNGKWNIALLGEYDFFWHGTIDNEMPTGGDVFNSVNSGDGVRFNLPFTRQIGGDKYFVVEPYFIYQDISASTVNCNSAATCFFVDGFSWKEAGVKLTVGFA